MSTGGLGTKTVLAYKLSPYVLILHNVTLWECQGLKFTYRYCRNENLGT